MNGHKIPKYWLQIIGLHSKKITSMEGRRIFSQKTAIRLSSSCERRFGVLREGMPRARVGVDSWAASWQFPQITP